MVADVRIVVTQDVVTGKDTMRVSKMPATICFLFYVLNIQMVCFVKSH